MAPLIPVLEVIDFRRAPYRHRAGVPIPQQHIKTAFKARGQARVPKAPRQPTVAAARRPRTQPSPCAAGAAAGFPAATLFRVSPPQPVQERPRFGLLARSGSDREEIARRGRHRFQQLHQRPALETGRDQQGVTERDAHALDRRLDQRPPEHAL